MSKTAAVIGGGPAGLMAAEILAQAGVAVTIYDAMPSMGRKFLMAGKSGLNLTKDAPFEVLLRAYGAARDQMRPILADFDSEAVQGWVRGLGQKVFTGTSGRVFPETMKASPLLRAWFARLTDLGVQRQTRWKWTGWSEDALSFETPKGLQRITADVTILALGGASWARLGSNGAWADILSGAGVPLTPFASANAGIVVKWSPHMERHFGTPLKSVGWRAGRFISRGEAVITLAGIEGGGVYTLSPALRAGNGAVLHLDLCPDLSQEQLLARLQKPRGKASLANHLRKVVGLTPIKIALLQEWACPLPNRPEILATLIKGLVVQYAGLSPMDQAISTSGGVAWGGMDDQLMLRARPGVFCAGEMLDWEAPTGGYLLTGCLASGRWAAQGALRYL